MKALPFALFQDCVAPSRRCSVLLCQAYANVSRYVLLYSLEVVRKFSNLESDFWPATDPLSIPGIKSASWMDVQASHPGKQDGKAGTFRATFEDKPLMSDIVFLSAWVVVDLPRFYNPVTNLLGPTMPANATASSPRQACNR